MILSRSNAAGATIGLLIAAGSAFATAPTTYNFTKIQGGPSDLGTQLSVLVEPVLAEPNKIDFTFRNNVGMMSSISEIYFDDGTLLAGSLIMQSAGVDFDYGSAAPPGPPCAGAVAPPFEVTMDFLADRNGAAGNGIDAPTESLTLRFDLQAAQDCDDVIAAITDGSLRIALNLVGTGGCYINQQTPAGPPPEVSCLIEGPLLVCPDEDAVFTVTETAGAPTPTFAWEVMGAGLFDNGMTTTTGPSATVVPNGGPGDMFTVEVTVTSGNETNMCSFVTTLDDCTVPDGECIWTQGEWDGVDGQTSETDTAVDDSKTADDFCLKEGFVYEINSISVCMLTNSTELDATLEIYEDCDGCPGELIDCGTFETFTAQVLEWGATGDLNLVKFTFDTGPRTVTDDYGNTEDKPGLWLKGGCYWLSPIGIGDGTGYDRYFWATAGDNLVGAIPKTQAEPFKIDGWEPVDGLNVSCRNFAFDLAGRSCCILQDNGDPDRNDVTGAIDTTGVGCYNADDFVIPLCTDISEICFFSAYIWTNCDCTRTKLSIMWDDCGEIDSRDAAEPGGGMLADKCIDTGRTITFENQELTLYRVEWHNPGFPIEGAGANAWAAIEVQGSGSLQETGFWAFADRCGTDCDVSFNPGQAICPPRQIIDWETVGRDYSFCLATRQRPGILATTGGATEEPACAADFNGDGGANINDMLDYLDAFFEGCGN